MKKLQVLGMGCPKCANLFANTEAAAKELGLEYSLEKVSKLADMMKFGVMTTPALVIDGKVVSAGKVPSVAEIKGLLG